MSADLDPFPQMANILTGGARASWPQLPTRSELKEPGSTRTEQIRQLLRMSGPLSAQNIAVQLDLPSPDRVSALLKVDLKRERVRRIGTLYEWNHAYDEALAADVAAAARLLRRNGFTVRRSA